MSVRNEKILININLLVMKREQDNIEDFKVEEDKLFKPLDEMKIPEPSSLQREKFTRIVEQMSARDLVNSKYEHIHIYLKVAVVAAVFVMGWFLGSINNRKDTELLQNVRNQLNSNNQLLVLTLLQQSSASDRLRAANVSYSLLSFDDQIISALVKALENDPDPNVKIKCAEALATHLKPDSINKIFGNALELQNEPLIQLILINHLKSIGNPESIRIVNNFINSEKVDDFVKSEVKKSINI